MYYGKIDNGETIFFSPTGGGLAVNDRIIINPSEELMNEQGWYQVQNVESEGTDYVEDGILYHYIGLPYQPTYEELVVQYIRERYSMDDEFGLLRQKDSKPDEFEEYNSYCEECKVRAREEAQ